MDVAIKTTNLTKSYRKSEALKGLDLEVPTGSVYGFLGRNGAGKTTTIKILLGLIRPSGGKVEVLGADPQGDSVAIKRRVGYVSENPSLYKWMRVHEILSYTAGLQPNWDDREAERLIDRFGLDPNAKIKTLSRGQAAQVGLVCALSHKPDLLILDEPVSGLDVLVRRDFLDSIIGLIQEEGRTVFLSSHLVHEIERVADWIGVVDDGRLLLADDIESFKGGVKEIIVRHAGDNIPLCTSQYVVSSESGGYARITAFDYGEHCLLDIKRAGCEVVDVQDLSLEDTFVAHIRRGNGRVQ